MEDTLLASLLGDTGTPRYSPDGMQIAFHQQTGQETFDIYVLDLESGEINQVTDLGGYA